MVETLGRKHQLITTETLLFVLRVGIKDFDSPKYEPFQQYTTIMIQLTSKNGRHRLVGKFQLDYNRQLPTRRRTIDLPAAYGTGELACSFHGIFSD